MTAESRASSRWSELAERLAGPALGFSLNGFYVYLGVLDLAAVAPRTALTGAYYVLLGAVLLAVFWPQRERALARIRAGGRPTRVFVAATGLLAAWFVVNAALLSEGSLSRRLVAQLLFWTIPTIALALSLSRRQLDRSLWTVTLLGVAVAVLDLLMLAGGAIQDRFTPIDDLDPITAGHIPALAAVAWLALDRPIPRRGEAGRAVILALLVCAAVLPGSRGPLMALALGLVVLAVVSWRRVGLVMLAAVAVGVATGSVLADQVGSSAHLTGTIEEQPAGDEPVPISSLKIRRQLLEKAVRAVPSRPLQGHGVAMLKDDTPEAFRMGIAGRRTYPHNTFVEAAYSLGIPGLLLFVTALAAAAWALLRLLRRRADRLAGFALAFFAFAFVNSNVSNELGADAWLWAACALALAVFAATGAAGEPEGRAEAS